VSLVAVVVLGHRVSLALVVVVGLLRR